MSPSAEPPLSFALAAGVGYSDESEVCAFDQALVAAGVGSYNFVPVSSILPAGANRCDATPSLPAGSIVHCVMSKVVLARGERGVACLGYALGDKLGVVAESQGESPDEACYGCVRSLREMTEARGGNFSVPVLLHAAADCRDKAFGCAVVLLVLLWTRRCS